MADLHKLEADVVIVGGGMAGVCAAVAAARHGAHTVLVQDRPVLGGNSSSEIGVGVSGADRSGARPHAREAGILEELRLEAAVRNPQSTFSMWSLLLWEWVMREPDLQLLLNTACTGVQMASASRIAAITASRESTEDRFVITAPIFMDCSGDGRLGYEAGADFRMGREGPEEHNEPHAEGPDNKTMGSSITWRARDMGVPVPFTPPPWAKEFLSDEDLPYRAHNSLSDLYTGPWWLAYGGELDTIKDAEKIRDELLAIMFGVWDHIKNRGDHGAANWALTWWNFIPGKRESRRLLGEHILTEQDVLEAPLFADRVAHGGWSIDSHPPGGIYASEPPSYNLVPDDIYSIPLRCLYSRNIENLFMAGRCASCTHVAMASTRVMGTAAVMGQAAGTAAAMCIERNCMPADVASVHIRELQQRLLKDDHYIPDLAADDPADHARQAEITASSEAPGCAARNVVSGVTRQRDGRTHQWASDPSQLMPQWLQLTWPEPVSIREIHLTCDTGFQRPLTLTDVEEFRSQMVWGRPQPETIRDYDVEVREAGGWRPVVRERGNYQRKRCYNINIGPTDSLRVHIYSTNGDASARIYEVRVY